MVQHLAIKANGSCSRRPRCACEEIKTKRVWCRSLVPNSIQMDGAKDAMFLEHLEHQRFWMHIFSPCSAAILKTARRRS